MKTTLSVCAYRKAADHLLKIGEDTVLLSRRLDAVCKHLPDDCVDDINHIENIDGLCEEAGEALKEIARNLHFKCDEQDARTNEEVEP